MLRLLFCFIIVVASKEAQDSDLSGPIELVLARADNGTEGSDVDASETFYELLNDFAKFQNHHFNMGNLHKYESFTGLPVAKFGLDLVNCEELLAFLHMIEAEKYHLKYVLVKCGENLSMSMCFTPPCDPEKYKA
ncbi:hypothetical protein OESDEN_06746 [Oesophagostomum dentatum]|uniref:Uncharacterized protein n=1 Tax=Oesophagostomum dentatum TaxID=61180 RepID=A0A0B1TDB1_OESDE|nr:hypothetical protein OESDEN_06746 [Oesophagostomum dentatum]